MSDNKRNRKYSKLKESKRPIILTKRDVGGGSGGGGSKSEKSQTKSSEEQIQPKILLKAKEKEQQTQISIAIREQSIEPSASQSPSTVSVQSKEKDPVQNITIIEQPIMPVPIMTRPITLISGVNFQVNINSTKVLTKTNTDFFVVGIVGTQGVGKSTIMNLLASDSREFDIHDSFFKDKGNIFPVKFKPGKASSLPRTESIHMFITNDRMILLDCPPVLCNSYKRDASTSELDDIKIIILLLTVCHLVIVIQDDFFNLSLIRLLQFGELTKPNQDIKPFVNDYFPNILFVKNRAKRKDFMPEEKLRTEQMLRCFFKDSQLKISLGQSDKHKRSKQGDDKGVNYFVFPEVKGEMLTSHHPSLDILMAELRNRVFMSPRNQIYNGTTELTEALWFELLTATTLSKSQFFLTTYEDIRRSHTHSGTDQGSKSIGYMDIVD